MKARTKVDKYYKIHFDTDPDEILALPGSGSDRKYFRVKSEGGTVIAVVNNNREENDAFVKLSEVFQKKGLPVPRIFAYFPDKHIYFQSDLGDINLYSWLENKRLSDNSDNEIVDMYNKVLDKLVDFQVKTIEDIDLEICYPHRAFDRQSMMWDMNYFKYMFLKLVAVSFNENKLEKDFMELAEMLMAAGQDYFLYRDFQSANIMVVNSSPWFIDYQGGRGGAPQYDVASLLYDSKVCLPEEIRSELLDYYLNKFCQLTDYSREKFTELYPAFVLIRIMQAMGAYGFRGIFEKKAGFARSIAPAVKDLHYLLRSSALERKLPELWKVCQSLQRKQNVFDKMK